MHTTVYMPRLYCNMVTSSERKEYLPIFYVIYYISAVLEFCGYHGNGDGNDNFEVNIKYIIATNILFKLSYKMASKGRNSDISMSHLIFMKLIKAICILYVDLFLQVNDVAIHRH